MFWEQDMVTRSRERIAVRKATPKDMKPVCEIDRLHVGDSTRQRFLRNAIRMRQCYIATLDRSVAGFAVMDRSFYEQSFVSLLVVHPEHRRKGVGSALMRHIEAWCGTEKLFTSTNESNRPMQRLCESLGYVKSGCIENLDEGDPELVYFKPVGAGRRSRRT